MKTKDYAFWMVRFATKRLLKLSYKVRNTPAQANQKTLKTPAASKTPLA
jgi:hypothetical protein